MLEHLISHSLAFLHVRQVMPHLGSVMNPVEFAFYKYFSDIDIRIFHGELSLQEEKCILRQQKNR